MAGFCPECGTAREDGAQTCGNCNHPFVVQEVAQETAQEAVPEVGVEAAARPKWLTPKWMGIGAGVIALATAGAWIATSDDGLFGLVPGATAAVDTSLLPVSFGGKCGYVDASGKMVINPQFENALAFDAELGLAPVLVGEKWGLINREGQYVVNPQFDGLHLDRESHVIAVMVAGKGGTIDGAGKFVINPQFDNLTLFDSAGRAIVEIGDKAGVIDASGKYIISPEFDSILPNWNWREDNPGKPFDLLAGPLLVIQQGKFGFVDESGKVIIQPQFVAAGQFDSSGYAPAAIEEVDTAAFERMRDDNANAVDRLIRERIWQVVLGDIRRDGGTLSFDLNNYMMTDEVRNWLIRNVSQGWDVTSNVNRDPQGFVTGSSIKLTQTLEAPKKNKFGYIDRSGKFVISPQFDEAGNFSDSGLASVRVGTAFGYVDLKGKVAINPQWSRAGTFRQINGAWLAVVGVSEEGSGKVRYGLIDTKGAYKINPQFESLGSFGRGGFAITQSGELQGAVDATGRYVLQPVYSMLLPVKNTSKFIFVKPIAGTKDMQEIGVIDGSGTVITTVRGGTCGGLYSFS